VSPTVPSLVLATFAPLPSSLKWGSLCWSQTVWWHWVMRALWRSATRGSTA
jgi:hypothetical protein